MKIERVAIVGDGVLTYFIQREMRKRNIVCYTLRKDKYNIVGHQDEIVKFCKDQKIDVLINCAAKTDVDWCEQHQQRAMKVNAEAPGKLYNALITTKTCPVKWFICFSSEMVFDGRKEERYVEEDPTSPRNVYGVSKATLEMLLLAIARKDSNKTRRTRVRYTCVRTSWLYHDQFILGKHFRGWPRSMIRRLHENKKIWVATDIRGCPTCYSDLAGFVGIVITEIKKRTGAKLGELEGIINAAGPRSVSRARWLQAIKEGLDEGGVRYDCREVIELPYQEYRKQVDEPTQRPYNGRLDSSKARSLGWKPKSWRVATEEIVRTFLATVKTFEPLRESGEFKTVDSSSLNW